MKALLWIAAPAVLPPYKRVILDEAHNIEEAATEHLGANITRRGLLRILNRLDKRGKGLLTVFENKLLTGKEDLLQQDALRQISKLRPQMESAREYAAALFQFVDELTARTDDGVLRLSDEFAATPAWTHGMDVAYENLLTSLAMLGKGVQQLRDTVMVDREWSEPLTEQLIELHGVAGRIAAAAGALAGTAGWPRSQSCRARRARRNCRCAPRSALRSRGNRRAHIRHPRDTRRLFVCAHTARHHQRTARA